MAERQVATAAVDIDLLAQVMHGHRRAFDVPTRPARPELRRPRGLVRRGPTPQRKIERIALAPQPDHPPQILVAQLAEPRPPGPAPPAAVTAAFPAVQVHPVFLPP